MEGRTRVGISPARGAATLCALLLGGLGSSSSLAMPVLGPKASVLVLPVLTDEATSRITLISVTNTTPAARVLYVNLIDGSDWSSQDFECYVTAAETTLFTLQPESPGPGSRIDFECTNPQTGVPEPTSGVVDLNEGVMFVAIQNPTTGETTNANALLGSATVVDFEQGFAYSVAPFGFAGVNPGAPGAGDRNFRFDGDEYAAPPESLSTNFFATSASQMGELILFALDGTVGNPSGPDVFVRVDYFDDDERLFSANHSFSCFSVVALTDISPGFAAAALGSTQGHLVLLPGIEIQSDATHDFLFDGGVGFDGLRRVPIVAWIVQISSGLGATGRKLLGSELPFVPLEGDVPTLSIPFF